MQNNNRNALEAVVLRWCSRFKCVKDKKQFNHWDEDAADAKFCATTGIGWSAQLLEAASRRDRQLRYIPTGCSKTEFSLAAMELGFGISSRDNRFRRGQTDFIKPDGLGVRRDGYFTVLEVSGPKDERSLVAPMWQATCGALAVFAKRTMLQSIALQFAAMRPAYPRVKVPLNSRSLGIHVLMHANPNGLPREPWSTEVENTCRAVLDAFRQLEYIAYSFVTRQQAEKLTRLQTDVLITGNGQVTFPSGRIDRRR